MGLIIVGYTPEGEPEIFSVYWIYAYVSVYEPVAWPNRAEQNVACEHPEFVFPGMCELRKQRAGRRLHHPPHSRRQGGPGQVQVSPMQNPDTR